ncbi:MAG TPA: LysR substrate-binding domain-containing protein [Beijerinckiaceae bacterium]|nr:LysR substrate-binding domain-containing protein [Beijerinckiaceae bacterium]
MKLTQLRSFHAVAHAGGFVAGAALLNVSQPTLTAQVAALEAEFGVELFVRRNRRTEITPAGRDLYAITTRMFAEEQEARQFLEDSKELRTGKLRVGAVGPFHVTEMLAAFNRRYPGIQISVVIGNSLEAQRALLDYETDVAVLAHIDEDERLLTIPYRRHEVVVFTRTDHPFGGREEIRLEELAGERFIVRELGSTTRRAFEGAMRARGVPMQVVMEIGSREAIREAVLRGIGIGYVSQAEFIPHPELTYVPIADADIYTYAHVSVLAERRNGRIVKAFLDIVGSLASAGPRPV